MKPLVGGITGGWIAVGDKEKMEEGEGNEEVEWRLGPSVGGWRLAC